MTCPACAGAAAAAMIAAAASAVLLTYPICLFQRPKSNRVAVPPASLPRVRRALFLLLFAALALTSCGGSDDKEDVQDVLDKAFTTSMESADLKVDATVQLKGSPSLDRPVRITATGPFRTNDGKLPSV